MDALVRLFSGANLFFTGGVFAACFGVFYLLYAAVSRWAAVRTAFCLAASLGFYYFYAGYFVLLPAAVALTDFLAAQIIHLTKSALTKKLTLGLALSVDLGLLSYFKYAGFLTGIFTGQSAGEILAPIGLSFFIFKSLSYVFDVYYETIEKPEKNYWYYLHYVTFFPAMLAGPIHRAESFLEESRLKVSLSQAEIAKFGGLFVIGLIKKTAIADVLAANLVCRVFAAPETYSGMENLTATLVYGLYLFNDFSGYSDMATGLAGLLGYKLAANFNEPFKSASVSEFWRRWHISLSQWFGDYVFKPLSFAWKNAGTTGAAGAAVITFALSGLWHGPAWTFVLWGLAHGLAIAMETLLAKHRRKWSKNPIYRTLSHAATLVFLILTYPLFAAPSLESAGVVYAKIFSDHDWATALKWWETYGPAVIPAIVAAVALHFLPTNIKKRLWQWVEKAPWPAVAVAGAAAVILVWQMRSAETLPFVYLKF